MSRLVLSALALFATILSGEAFAQSTYPIRSVRVIVPFAVGTAGDLVSRTVSHKMAELLGQPFVIENRPGARGEIGVRELLRSDPDGYTLCHCHDGQLAINPAGYLAAGLPLPYDPLRDFVPLGMDFMNHLVLAVNNELPVRTVRDLIEYSRANPGRLAIGASGPSAFLIAGLLKSAGIDMVVVPNNLGGEAESVRALLGNHIQVLPSTTTGIRELARSGSVKLIGAAGSVRNPFFPDLPTLGEQGLTDFDRIIPSWGGYFARRGTPPEVATVISRALRIAVNDPVVARTLLRGGIEPRFEEPEESAGRLASRIADLVEMLRRTGTVLITR